MEGKALEALQRLKEEIEAVKSGEKTLEISPEDMAGVLCYIFTKGPEYMQTLNKELSQADKEISRIYHEIENTNFNAAQGYQLAKKLQQALRHRRQIKLNYEILQILTPFLSQNQQRVLTLGQRIYNKVEEYRAYRR